jgi:ribosomal protein S5
MGTNNKVNNARCVISALRSLRPVEKSVKTEKTGTDKAVAAKA